MEFRQIEAFINVVKYQSFSKAAKIMFLSQPTVSAHVVSLEQELSCRLFNRTTKRVEVTADGERLYEYARKMLELRDQVYDEFIRPKGERPSLVLAGDSIALQYVLPDILKDLSSSTGRLTYLLSRRTVWIRSRCYLKKKLISDFWGNMKMCRNLPLSLTGPISRW